VNGFEGSTADLEQDSVLECGVCWWVYDPATGDDTWQIPPGTAFSQLPDHWRCPNCDAASEQFMVLQQAVAATTPHPRPTVSADRKALRHRERDLFDAYSAAATRMRSLPVYNEKLDIRIVGLQRWEDNLLCIAATPWCMNILIVPSRDVHPRMEGTIRELEFPSGRYSFTAGNLAGVGPIESCSLFSPMEQFEEPSVVEAVARHAIRGLLQEPEAPAMSRRGFLRGGRQADERPRAR
jgi:[NiFe] hydrogenase assembly HybE family chaperone